MSIATAQEPTLPAYFRDIADSHALSDGEELNLSSRIQNGDQDAVKELVLANLRFVVKVALRYQHRGLSLSDLIEEGNWGLIQAAKRFDGQRNCKFISYAVWWIRHAILQALAENGRMVRQPETQLELLRHVLKTEHELEQRLGRTPSDEDVSAAMGVSPQKVAQVLQFRNTCISMDAPADSDDNCTLHDVLPDPFSASAAAEESIAEEINMILGNLDGREEEVVRLYFGLDGVPCQTLSEVGKHCHLTGERVRQVKQRALRKLRSYSSFHGLRATVYH